LTDESNASAPFVKYPFAVAIIIICIVILIVWLNQKSNTASELSQSTGQSTTIAATSPASPTQNFQLKPPSISGAGSGRDTPKIIENMNRSSAGGSQGNTGAPGLGGLLAGLEDKVRSDPGNVNNRLLLAQTYNELGLQDKALVELRGLQSQNPEHVRVNLILASILSQSIEPKALKEALTLLDKVESGPQQDSLPYLVHMYKGDALIRTQDHSGALASWKKALETMPASDNRRTMLEKRIADINADVNAGANAGS